MDPEVEVVSSPLPDFLDPMYLPAWDFVRFKRSCMSLIPCQRQSSIVSFSFIEASG